MIIVKVPGETILDPLGAVHLVCVQPDLVGEQLGNGALI
jgi:hypothetical protein